MQRSCKQLIIIVIAMLFLAAACGATIIHVPADHVTVQGALDASANGDTVLVSPGRYVENLNFRTKQVVLASTFLLSGDPDDISATILDGSNPVFPDTASIVIIAGGQDTTTVLMGFTLTGGRGTKWKDVSDNKIYREGGAILTEASSPLIKNNIIINNRATEKGTGVASAGGGGIRCGFGPVGRKPYLIGNVFAYNQGLYGGGLVSFHCPVVVKNNIFWKNSGGQDFGGAGLWIWNNNEQSIVENNSIVGNTTTNQGGGLYISSADADVRNNIIRGNTGIQAQLSAGGGIITVSYNNIQGGYAGTGNIDQDPLFAPTNLFLTGASPCVDNGDSAPGYDDREDSANPGSALFPSLGGLRNDMGAYGGLLGQAMPLFTSPLFSTQSDTLDLGVLPGPGSVEKPFYFRKMAFGAVTVDSVRLGHVPLSELYSMVHLPMTLPVEPTVDSLVFSWNPTADEVLLDTLRIYHKDTTTVSPLLVIVKGKVSCCIGTRGNVDGWGTIDLSDLSYLIAYLTTSPVIPLPCEAATNVNGVGVIDLADLSRLIAYLLRPPGAITLSACP